MKPYLLGTAVAVLFTATPAFSDCTPLVPDDGDTITCTGTDTDGVHQTLIDNGNLDDIRLDVTSTLSNADSGEHTVELDDDATVMISSTGRVEDVSGKHAIKLDEVANVENAGLIQAGKDGLNLGVNAVVHNTATASTIVTTVRFRAPMAS